jgi:EAL domain-containing protein (putative c-di-GMP-specific phosphodiesterase class I)/GGDEF domain-containing protein
MAMAHRSQHPLHFSTGDRSGPLSRLMAEGALAMVYQPIVSLTAGSLYGHEALVRGPQGMPLQSPDALFAAARRESLAQDFEVACLVLGLKQWAAMQRAGRLFLNISASALVHCFDGLSASHLGELLTAHGVRPERLVFEITEHEHVGDIPRLIRVAEQVHATGARFALDDFGDGRSSLRLWSELAPDYVKIDKYFTADIAHHAQRLKTLRALLQIAETFGSSLVAEGIETADDLRVLRDLGMSFGQGFFLGRPQKNPHECLEPEAAAVVGSSRVAVLPALRVAPSPGRLSQAHVLKADAVLDATTCDALARLFDSHPNWHAVAFVDASQRPIGLLGRQDFLDRYAKPFFKEIYGRKPGITFANPLPTIVDADADFDALVAVLMSPDQRYLTEGFIYVQNGLYLGLGTGHQLVRQVTESRLEAARHANPLTLLPGNIPISEHIDRLCAAGADFVACYADLANFKPFNDYYGYWRGDEAIKLLSLKIQSHCDPRRDFVGHVGGDDFVMLFQSHDWEARTERIVAEFDEAVRLLYDAEAQSQGGIEAEDRHGTRRFFGFISLYMGAVPVRRGLGLQRASEVANAAALAKQRAKVQGLAVYVEMGASVPAAGLSQGA